jgi:PAS domain S-box-containing protein
VFVDVNESFLQLTGYDRNEVIGHTIVELDLWVDSAARDHILQAIAGGQTIRNQELRVRIKSGELRVGLCSFAAIDLPGEVCALTMFQDITERKRMERDLLEAERQRVEFEKERELIELKERFISVVSHDLRTPLAVIVSSTDILQRYQDRLSPERQQEHFRKIQKQATGMTEMMQEILLLSKAHAGKLSFDPAPTDVERFCLELFDQVRLTSKTDHDFVFNLRAPIGEAMLDEKLLQHILLNLLTNAVKYSPDGGEVRFELWEQGESLYFQISDQGIGVPPEAQARLFEPFHRAKNVGDIIGTGLGMAIAKENVDRHGGTIVCESRVGEGSTFTVTLPITPA